jgi:putative oxidoreductase
MTVTRVLARPLLASTFLVGAMSALKNAEALGAKARPVTDKIHPVLDKALPQVPVPSDPVTLVRINAAAQIVAAVALARGRAPRLASTVLAASTVPTTAAGHQFWKESDPAVRQQQMLHFFKNLSMLGGLMLAAVDTDGKPGVAWRTKHGVSNTVSSTRREAKHLAREAKLQARLTAKQAGL